ncbi:MAG: FHA domain-containing protein [Treponema sp.]|nr:FHA domain-containing protein [Treponema sp.]
MDETIITSSPVGQRLEKMKETDVVSYLKFNNNKINLVAKITIGRSPENNIVIDNKLVSRQHAIIQKINNEYFLKDAGSTNGTMLNGKKIVAEKYYKLYSGDTVTIGTDHLVFS